jgi:transcription antitermination factor NusG
MSPERDYGRKYDSKLSNKEIASRIRQDVKNAISKRKLPNGLKVSVRYQSYSGGSSIHLNVTAWPPGFNWLNPAWVKLIVAEPHRYHEVERYTPKAKEILKKLEEIHGAYNHDGSDSMSDHFDVKYYGAVDVDCFLEQPEVERVWKILNAGPKVTLNRGDQVTFSEGPYKGKNFIVAEADEKTVSLLTMSGRDVVEVDGEDLNNIKLVKSMPQGMKVVRFK